MNNGTMLHGADISAAGAVLAEPARAAILLALSGGVGLPASELARHAGVTPSTTSTHLARLLEIGWVTVERYGRHRYYRLASPRIAAALEGLASVVPAAPARSLKGQQQNDTLRTARSCYDHLAGRLGVALTDALVQRDALRLDGSDYALSEGGAAFLRERGVEVPVVAPRTRAFARRCLDWSERRDHLAGALGAAVLAAWLGQGWVERQEGGRTLRLTSHGLAQLPAWGVTWPAEVA